MKLDIKSWKKVTNPDGKNIAPKGRLRLRVTPPSPLYVEAVDPETGEFLEVLAGHSADFDVTSDLEMTFRIVGADDVFVFDPRCEVFEHNDMDEVFTNIDKMPLASEQYDEVTSALRLFKLQVAHETRLIRAEREQLMRARQTATADVHVEPVVEPAVSDGDGVAES